MINKKVKDDNGQEYTLIQFVVHENKIKAILQTLDGKFFTEEYHKIRLIK